MGEVATSARSLLAFESQLQKVLASVPRSSDADGHDSVQLQYVALSRLDDVVNEYSQRLCKNPEVLAAALIQSGEQLERFR